MFKKIIINCLLFLICANFLSIPDCAFAGTVPLIEGNTAVGQIGDTVKITFSAKNAEAVCGGNFNIVYDTGSLQVVAANPLELLQTSSPVINLKYDGGKKIRITWASLQPMKPQGDLIEISFKIKEGCKSGSFNISIADMRLYDIDSGLVGGTNTNGSINVKNTYLNLSAENINGMVSFRLI